MWRVSSASTTSASRSSASTRSVTSSRLPIGVAQTASGTAERLEGDQPGADQPGVGAELRELDLDLLPAGGERLAQHREPRGGQQQLERRDAEAAADHDALGAEDVDERADRDAEVVADLVERRVPLARRGRARSRPARARAARACRQRGPSSTPRRDRGPSTRPGTARRPRRSPCARARSSARKSAPPTTTPPPTPVPSVSMTRSVVAAARAERELGVGRAARVVLHRDRQPEPPLHLVAERHVAQRDVDGAERRPRAPGRSATGCRSRPRRRRPAAARARSSASSSSSAACDVVTRRALEVSCTRPVGVDDAGEDLRPAEVDTDHTICRHARWVT